MAAKAESELKAAAEKLARQHEEARAQAEEKADRETEARIQAEKIAQAAQARESGIYPAVVNYEQEESELEQSQLGDSKTQAIDIVEIRGRTVTCECCGNQNVPANQAERIDSGQLFCPDCLRALRAG